MSKHSHNRAVSPFPQIPVARIVRNPEQPRKIFDEQEMQELAESVREHGIIQPISVEACGDDYILHDGERRWRAAQIAGLKQIPAIVSPPLNGTGPRERLERALVANMQRSEMHPIEEGYAYQRLITEFNYSISDVAKKVSKSYTRIAYCLSLLQLETEIQQLMLERKLPSADHKILTALQSVPAGDERIQLCQALAKKDATARMIVEACHRYNMAKAAARGKKKSATTPAMDTVSRKLPEWDALYQLGKVPPWQVITDAVMATCDACPLRYQANSITCGECGLVIGLKRMMEIAHGH